MTLPKLRLLKSFAIIQSIEQLRPSYVYGKGENGKTAKKAEECFKKIKLICGHIIKKNEREPEDSN